MVLIDSYMYGRWHFAPLNLIQYNLLENKSSLYGVESILFYIKNLFLNWSIAFPCALISWVAFMNRHVIWSTTVILWFVVFLVQPHKEERFLFPIYPFMAWGSSELIRRIPSTLFRRSLCLVFFLISLFRIAGLVHYYAAPLHLDLTSTQGLVCLGPDWYYFPGHFFVPPIARLGFFPIDAGELPDLYDEAPLPLATRKDVEFNGMNRNNPDRFKKISECNFFIGSFPPVNSTALQCVSMLDAAHTSTLNRVLYHPFKKYQTWRPYCLFENKS
ncbi:hypothetical protein HMI55_006323 [Coelomomyces lativittatus]|nr:hypothetical protein HMI55_006323 [Coelomomyces lativittatus]